MIPNTQDVVALFEIKLGLHARPVIAWDDDGEALVVATSAPHKLVRARDLPNFTGLEEGTVDE